MPQENHFNQSSATWDTPEKIAGAKALAEAIRTELHNRTPKRILEIGCGTGLLGAHFITPESEYVGVDNSPGMLERLREKFPGNGKVRALELNLDEALPAEGGFDLVLSSMAFHHLRDPADLLKRLAPLLAPGCELAIADLDKEDGSFHSDPARMGVKHFGFSEEDVASWQSSGLELVRRKIVQHIEKNGKRYPQFLSLLRKP